MQSATIRPAMENEEYQMVRLKCVREGAKLRVRIISPGYLPRANVQCSRAMRIEGRTFLAHPTDIRINQTHKPFYSCKKMVVEESGTVSSSSFAAPMLPSSAAANCLHIHNLYDCSDSEECVICMVNEKSVVIGPCGHYFACADCAQRISVCSMCRQTNIFAIPKHLVRM